MTGTLQILLAGAGAAVPTWAATVIKSITGVTACSCGVVLETDGRLTGTQGGPAGGFTDTATGKNWFAPATTGVGSRYWYKATLQSGSAPTSGLIGAWASLSTGAQWVYNSGTTPTVATRSGVLAIQIAADAAGATILGSGTLTFNATRDNS